MLANYEPALGIEILYMRETGAIESQRAPDLFWVYGWNLG